MKIYFDLYKKPTEDWLITKKFLERCKEVGYDKISIGTRSKDIPDSCLEFFIGPNNVFGSPSPKLNGWPAIWEVVHEFKISGGAGNSHQHQIKPTHKLILGYYKLINNNWEKIR